MTKKKWTTLFALPIVLFTLVGADNCTGGASREAMNQEKEVMGENQARLNRVQPAPTFDYSLQRDVLIQIYQAINENRPTFTVVESITGTPRWVCPSIGYAIPADTSLTNPLQGIWIYNGGSVAVEQPEPNGLYSSKNTDGTWVLCVEDSGTVAPRYTEHKVHTFPYVVELDGAGMWVRAAGQKASTAISLSR